VTAESIAHELGDKRSGSNYLAKCPVHDDKNPSLSLRDVGGKVLVKCHAGCSQQDVIAALRERGLWQAPEEYTRHQKRIVAEYNYTDERGELLYQVVRYEPKDFRPRYPDGDGGWIWKKHPHQVLYRLREVLENTIIFVVEGERDVETLREHGFVATCEAGGAKAPWLDSYSASLAGREVIIIPDNDAPGWERATVIARALLGVAARIRIFDLPKGTKDISDWFAAGHSECELIAMLEGVHAV
jgi:putative DNA primase/helicase